MDEFIAQVELAQHDEGVRQQLLGYEAEIVEQLEHANNRVQLRTRYFALGCIEKLKENYIKSNDYFLKVTRLGELKHHGLNLMLYRSLSTNYLNVSQIEKSQEYFLKAEAIAIGYGDQEMLAKVYQSRAYDLTHINPMYDEAVSLLQKSLYLTKDSRSNIISNLQLSEVYMYTYAKASAINYSLRALELSIVNNSEHYQKLSSIALGLSYLQDREYEKSIDILEKCLLTWPDHTLIDYVGELLVAHLYVSGLDIALSKLEEYEFIVLEKIFKENEAGAAIWRNTMKSQLYAKDNQPQKALAYWQDGISSIDEDFTNPYGIWRRKLYLDIQFMLNPANVELITDYEELYQRTLAVSGYPTLKSGLLQSMINHVVSLGEYELAYHYMQKMMNNFSNEVPDGIEFTDLYEWLNKEIDLSSSEERDKTLLKWFVHFNIYTVMGYCIVRYHKKNQMLETKLNKRLIVEPVTSALTLPVFYQEVEKWFENDNEITFLAIDIDYFKKYNQTYGLLAGEVVLKQVAQCILQMYPQALMTRFKGCQFIVAVEGGQDEVLLKVQELIQSIYDLNLSHVTNLDEERITVSIGVNRGIITSRLKVDKRINMAQKSLKEAKQKGRNTFVI